MEDTLQDTSHYQKISRRVKKGCAREGFEEDYVNVSVAWIPNLQDTSNGRTH